jgi:Leucine-rich repeat (LRR) protein
MNVCVNVCICVCRESEGECVLCFFRVLRVLHVPCMCASIAPSDATSEHHHTPTTVLSPLTAVLRAPSSTQVQSRLNELDLSFNALAELPALPFLRSLRVLNLSANKISALLSSVGSLSSLEVLRLTGNNIEYISPDIGQLVSLEKLYLQNNQIKTVPTQFTRLVKLEDLDLSGNPLTELPDAFALPNLEVLDLNGCGLRLVALRGVVRNSLCFCVCVVG